jgi:hypothetical protein
MWSLRQFNLLLQAQRLGDGGADGVAAQVALDDSPVRANQKNGGDGIDAVKRGDG